MRILGLDVGDKRIGLAVSDPTGLLATPQTVIYHTAWEKDVAAIAEAVRTYQAEAIVVGLPLHMDGSPSEQSRRVRRFVRRLKGAVALPIHLWDERLSSYEATKLLEQAAPGARRRPAFIDAAAAAVILQSYLDEQRRANTPGGGAAPPPAEEE